MQELNNIIIQSILNNGPISFRDFMDKALYQPGLGYYVSGTSKIGEDGDYYTAPAISPLFGEMLSKQVIEMWTLMGKKDFTIFEYGAGNATLCCHVLDSLRKYPEIYNKLSYFILEKNDLSKDEKRSFPHPMVKWTSTVTGLTGISGCILSNELIDNFAVHAVVMKDELMEVFIDHRDGRFYELLKPADTELKTYFSRLGVTLPRDFRAEVNLQALGWLKEISTVLERGFVITIDYGCISEELYAPQKSCGSILCYHKHQINNKPFDRIGEQDITAHVNFSALKLWGTENDLQCCGYTSQLQFLRSFGIMNILREMESEKNPDREQILKLKTLVLDMGQKIKLMVHQKGLAKQFLTGMQFQLPI
jgi:SAM-dependent MidA family methyltransferase